MSVVAGLSGRRNWKWATLADVGKLVTGNTPPTKVPENYGDAIPFVKPTELVDASIHSAPQALSHTGAKIGRTVPAGAVLVSCIGVLGKTGIARVPVALNQQINAIVFGADVLPEFGFYYAQTLRSWLHGQASATTLPIVNKGKFQQAPFPLAPIDEQREIVAEIEKQFSRLDEGVTNLKRAKANLKRYKAAVRQAAIEGRLVPTEAELARREGRSYETGAQLLQRILAKRRAQWSSPRKYKEPEPPDTDLPELAEGWVWASIEQLSSLVEYGSSTKTSEDARGVPVVRMGNIHDGALVFHDMKYLPQGHGEFPKLLLAPGDLLFNRTNSADLVGKTAVFKGAPQPCSFASYLIRARLVDKCLPPFVAAYINSSYGREWVKSVVTQQVGQANVNGTKLQALTVPLPPSAEQHRIVAEVDRCFSIVREAESQLDANLRRADCLRESTLAIAFS